MGTRADDASIKLKKLLPGAGQSAFLPRALFPSHRQGSV